MTNLKATLLALTPARILDVSQGWGMVFSMASDSQHFFATTKHKPPQFAMRTLRILLVGMVALASANGPSPAQGTLESVHITFDGQPPGTDYFVIQYFEPPMWFRPIGIIGPGHGFSRTGGGSPSWVPDNGTAYISATLGDSLVFSMIDDSPFDLASVDLAEFSTLYQEPLSVHFVGYRLDGSMVTRDIITDGIIDGAGPIPDFQTFTFGADFSNLVRVEIPTSPWSLDNLVVAIPEPSTSGILALGAAMLWRRIRSLKR